MTVNLVKKVCTPFGAELHSSVAARYRAEVPAWTIVQKGRAMERMYRFGNFREALAFADRVGALADSEGHHPDICFGWGYAKVSLQTKKIKGPHENDFIMAAKIDQVAAA
jgi:4a-hydroxytetrahydrobiopterin dehydratase